MSKESDKKGIRKYKNTKAATEGERIADRAEGKSPKKQHKRGWLSKGKPPGEK